MGRTTAATSAVKLALDELSEVVQPLPPPSREWKADRTALHRVWSRLNGCLHDAEALIKNPRPGQGLESVWLRSGCMAVSDIEAELRRWHYGWDDVLRRCDSELRWLVFELPHAGEKLISGTYEDKGEVSQLLEPDQPTVKRLRGLAAEWTTRFQNAPKEPQGFVLESILQSWEPWRKLRDTYVKRAGILILEAVDALDVRANLLQNSKFLRQVVLSLDTPEYLPLERSINSGQSLAQFIDDLVQVGDEDQLGLENSSDGQPTQAVAVDETTCVERLGRPIAASPNGALKLFGPQHPVVVGGVEYGKLTAARYEVLMTLCEAGTAGLKKRDLIHRSEHSSAVDILRKLAAQDERWASVIMMGGVSGGRYRLA